jgi:hypothetical protein
MSDNLDKPSDIDVKHPDVTDILAVPEPSFDDNDLQTGLRKVDYRLLPVLGILYLFSYLDRGSLANASIFGMTPSFHHLTSGFKQSLGITTTQYNLIVTVSLALSQRLTLGILLCRS